MCEGCRVGQQDKKEEPCPLLDLRIAMDPKDHLIHHYHCWKSTAAALLSNSLLCLWNPWTIKYHRFWRTSVPTLNSTGSSSSYLFPLSFLIIWVQWFGSYHLELMCKLSQVPPLESSSYLRMAFIIFFFQGKHTQLSQLCLIRSFHRPALNTFQLLDLFLFGYILLEEEITFLHNFLFVCLYVFILLFFQQSQDSIHALPPPLFLPPHPLCRAVVRIRKSSYLYKEHISVGL